MEQFLVSARKYRPNNFSSLVGQSHVEQTLRNALKNDQLAQAFLFCGPRGVGKTSTARILAKTINCENPGENFEPCSKCSPCTTFSGGQSLNIFELDAASNNSVDDIRNLIDQVRFAPQQGKYKVYIIDEVHMLSTQAFNAFLKTLEEPPPYAIFILATTEKHKIIPTILSRCQVFDFHKISVSDIVKQLELVAKSENIQYTPDALHIIAQKADGAMRDALSIFDQLCNSTSNNLEYQSVIKHLNVLDYEVYFNIMENCIEGSIPGAIKLFDKIINDGFDGSSFIKGLAIHIRNLLMVANAETTALLELSENIQKLYSEQSAIADQIWLLDALNLVNETEMQYRNHSNQRLSIELCLMQICSIGRLEKKKSNEYLIVQKSSVLDQISSSKTPPQKVHKPLSTPTISTESEKQTPQSIEKLDAHATKTPLITRGQNEDSPSVKPNLTLSIKATLQDIQHAHSNQETEKAEDENPISEEKETISKADNPINQKELMLLWNKYAEKIKDEGKSSLFSILSKTPIYLPEENLITVSLDNSALIENFNQEKPDLLSFLKLELGVKDLQIDFQVIESKKSLRPYTNKEKFEFLSQKFSLLGNLKDGLDLQIDF